MNNDKDAAMEALGAMARRRALEATLTAYWRAQLGYDPNRTALSLLVDYAITEVEEAAIARIDEMKLIELPAAQATRWLRNRFSNRDWVE